MELIKKVCFIIIPITTLLIALAYGLEIIFGVNITYLGMEINGVKYPNVYNFQAYLTNLNANDIVQPFKNLADSVQILIAPINDIKKIFEEGTIIDQTIGIIYNISVMLIDLIIFIMDILLSIIQCILVIISKIFSLVGINTNADIELFTVYRSITQFQITEGLPGWTEIAGDTSGIIQPGYIPIKF